MRIKFIEQMMFKIRGRSVPVIEALDISDTGRVGALHLIGELGKRDSSIVNTWDEKTYEIDRNARPIPVLDAKGIVTNTYIISETGKTINLYTEPRDTPNAASILGRFSMADDIADNMVLGKSLKNLVIGIIVGAPLWWFIFQIFGAMMK
jgi:hypothetical protein